MKLMHCADLHLDSPLSRELTPEKAAARRRELLEGFSRLADTAEGRGCSGILIAGDLFDRALPSRSARDLVLHTVCAHPGLTFYLLRGNHDDGALWSEERPENLCLFESDWREYRLGRRVSLWGAENPGNTRLWDRMNLDPGRINLVMLHGTLSEYPGGEDAIPLSRLRGRGIDYLALGHIHRRQEGELDGRGIWCYPGCAEGRGFDECGPCGVMLVDINEDTGEITPTFLNTARRQFAERTVELTGISSTAEAAQRILRALEEKPISGEDSLLLHLTGQVNAAAEVDTDYLTQVLAPRFYTLRIRSEVIRVVSPEELSDSATLKGAFLRLVQSRTDLSPEERGEIAAMGLRALAGEEI